MNENQIRQLAMQAAEAAGKNVNVAPQLLFSDIYLTLADALAPATRTIYKTGAVGISTVALPAIPESLLPAELNAITLALIFYGKNISDRIDGGMKDELLSAIHQALRAVGDATGSRKCLPRDVPPQPPCDNEHVAEGCEQFSAGDEKPCPTCHDQDEIACSFCETCKGAGWVPKVAD